MPKTETKAPLADGTPDTTLSDLERIQNEMNAEREDGMTDADRAEIEAENERNIASMIAGVDTAAKVEVVPASEFKDALHEAAQSAAETTLIVTITDLSEKPQILETWCNGRKYTIFPNKPTRVPEHIYLQLVQLRRIAPQREQDLHHFPGKLHPAIAAALRNDLVADLG